MANGVRINKAKAEAAVSAMAQEAVMRGANKYRERVRREILSSGRVRSGEMFTNIAVRPLPPSKGVARAVVDPQSDHFVYQDQGTKAYVAPHGKVMVWQSGGGGGVFVFARKRLGVAAGHFLAKARAKMKIEDFA
jgi:hypothetical protein